MRKKNSGENSQNQYIQNVETVILIHGLAASHHDWDDLAPLLIAKGFSVFTPDLPGHSNHFVVDSQNFNIDYLNLFLSDYVEKFSNQGRVILIGHSLGGYLAIKYSAEHPEKVKALVLCNPLISLFQLPKLFCIFFSNNKKFDFGLIQFLPSWMVRMAVNFSSYSIRNGYDLSSNKREMTTRDYLSAQTGIYNFLYCLPDLIPLLKQIYQPTLVIFGKKDRTLDPKWQQNIINYIPGLVSSMSVDAGHVPHQSNSIEFNNIVLNFIEQLM